MGTLARLNTCIIGTPLGDMLGATVETVGAESVCLLEFHDRRALPTECRDLERRFASAWPEPGGPTALLGRLAEQVTAYFAGTLKAFDVPLVTPGTAFQQRVWAELLRIPYGRTVSYGGLAGRTGSVARAVGQANGANRIAIVVPCHRVIDSGGSLGGYGGKLWRKERLLELEGALTPTLLS
jgi:AraC family transcriptional regulator of adaptative response/methylated-DNA-[protein]-cysteine methyltransferase